MKPFSPAACFDRLAIRFPGARAFVLSGCALAGLLLAAGLIASHRPLWAAPFLLAALIADGWGQAKARCSDPAVRAASPLGLMLVPFGFALGDPARALAAMFLVLALAVFTTERARGGQVDCAGPHGLAGAGLVLACLLSNYFSFIAYIIGLTLFIMTGRKALARG